PTLFSARYLCMVHVVTVRGCSITPLASFPRVRGDGSKGADKNPGSDRLEEAVRGLCPPISGAQHEEGAVMAQSASLPIITAESGLGRYLDEIRRFPMLEPQEEYMLAKRWREHGDRVAAHKLVTS